MLRTLIAVSCCALLAAPAVAADLDAQAAKKFFNDKGCNACHERDEARIGPPYRVIAIRYAAESSPERIESLAMKIRHGGAGAWGTVPMVSNPGITQEEAESVARWILGLGQSGSD